MTLRKLPTFSLFVVLLFAVSVPFWLAGVWIDRLLPNSIPIVLPFSALMTVCPTLIATALLFRKDGWSGVKALWLRVFDVRRVASKTWLAAAVLAMPAVLLATFLLMRMSGYDLSGAHVAWSMAPFLFGLFFVGAAGEELGWQGFAFGLLEKRHTVFESALVLGMVWAAWHIVPYFQTGHDVLWVAWQCVVTVFLRVITVWLFAYGGRSVFLAILFHAMCNVSMFLFPNYGSLYDPATVALVLAVVTAAIAAVWGPRMVQASAVVTARP